MASETFEDLSAFVVVLLVPTRTIQCMERITLRSISFEGSNFALWKNHKRIESKRPQGMTNDDWEEFYIRTYLLYLTTFER